MQCLETTTTSIVIEELRELDFDWSVDLQDCDWDGDLKGYFADGHHNPVAFVQSVNAEYDLDCPAKAHQVRHEFWIEYSLEIDSDSLCLEKCEADVEGAFAVTYIEHSE